MKDKIKGLLELLKDEIKIEKDNMEESRAFGVNCAGYCLADGAKDAYQKVLDFLQLTEDEFNRKYY